MQLIKAAFESLAKSLIRFFDNRFVVNNDIEWYRMELDKQRLETQRLINYIIEPRIHTEEPEIQTDFRPLGSGGYKSWQTKRHELEEASRLKAIQLANEARIAIAKTKSTEELEDELGIING